MLFRSPIVTVRTDDGHDYAFHAFHTVAKGELAKVQPRVGDWIGIAYHGPHPTKGYERYRIVIARYTGGEAIGGPTSQDPAPGGGAPGDAAPSEAEDGIPYRAAKQ